MATAALVILPAMAAAGPATQWYRSFNGAAGGNDSYAAVAVDSAGNAYVAGKAISRAPRSQDAVVASYAPDGHRRWLRLFNGPGGGSDAAVDVVRDAYGGICIAGRTARNAGDVLIVRYSRNGGQLWWRSFDYAGHPDRAVAMVADSGGHVYVAADCGLKASHRLVIYKLNRSGSLAWSRAIGTGTTSTQPADIDLSGENVVVCGTEHPAGQMPRSLIATLSPEGAVLWKTSDASASGGYGEAVTVKCAGTSIWVAGKIFEGSTAWNRSYVTSFSQSGARLGSYETPAGALAERLSCLSAQTDGVAWASGSQSMASGGTTVALRRLLSDGTVGQSYVFPVGYAQRCAAIRHDDGGSVWLAGLNDRHAYVTGFTLQSSGSLGWWGIGACPSGTAKLPAVRSVTAAVWLGGAMYVAGAARSTTGRDDALLIRFSPLL